MGHSVGDIGWRDHRSKGVGSWSCTTSTRIDYAKGPRSHTIATGQPDDKCGVMKVLKAILESSLPPVIKGKLSAGDVAKIEFQSDCCACSVEIRNRQSLKSGREGGGRIGRWSSSVGRGS